MTLLQTSFVPTASDRKDRTVSDSFAEQLEQLERVFDSTLRGKADPHGFSTFDLEPYQRHVLRWAHCAPDGALLLPAPLSGWRGEPFTTRQPLGPDGCPGRALRDARVKRGLDPIRPQRFDADGKPCDDFGYLRCQPGCHAAGRCLRPTACESPRPAPYVTPAKR